jgi:hypothetical protein
MEGEEDIEEIGSQPPSQQQVVGEGVNNNSNSNGTNSNVSNTKDKRKKGKPPEYPCLCCGENCNKTQQAVKCIMCALWAHKDCIRMPDTTFRSLDEQMRETGTAYWVCRPCQSFGQRVQHQFAESNRRHDVTEKRLDDTNRRVDNTERRMDKIMDDMKKLAERMDKESEKRDDNICDEMQEREVRRMNLIIHGVDEQPDEIRGNYERSEKDKERCEKIFKAMKARTKKDDLRFCRRIGERGENPRPIVVGLENEEEKRHILGRARELRNTQFQDVSIVPDLTRKQRNREAKMKDEVDEKNKTLTVEEKNRNIKWMVVGRRGEKRIIKGVERDQQRYGDNRWTGQEGRANPNFQPIAARPVVPQPQPQAQPQQPNIPQLGPRLLPQQDRGGRWYAKERTEAETGARSKTKRPENRTAGAKDQQERWQDRSDTTTTSRTTSKRTRWSGTSSEEEERPWTRQRK